MTMQQWFKGCWIVTSMISVVMVSCSDSTSGGAAIIEEPEGLKLSVGVVTDIKTIQPDAEEQFWFQVPEDGNYMLYVNGDMRCNKGCDESEPQLLLRDTLGHLVLGSEKVYHSGGWQLMDLAQDSFFVFTLERTKDALNYQVILLDNTGNEGTPISPISVEIESRHVGTTGSLAFSVLDEDNASFYRFTPTESGDHTILLESEHPIGLRLDVMTDPTQSNTTAIEWCSFEITNYICTPPDLQAGRDYYIKIYKDYGYSEFAFTIAQ